MSVVQPDRERRLLPRWQPSKVAISAGELAASQASVPPPVGDVHFDERKNEWRTTHSFEVAAELIGSAIVLGRTEEVADAARFVLDAEAQVGVILRDMAKTALGVGAARAEARQLRLRGRLDRPRVYEAISVGRAAVHRHPRDVLGWVDLARLYTILGQNDAADRALRTARALASDDRFVIRSTARFLVHIGDADRALAMLQRTPALRGDPWLMAAEIAVAQLNHRSSRSIGHALQSVDAAGWTHRSMAELHGSVATQLLYDGKTMRARRMFQESLIDPTENAVAQAQWAVEKDRGLVIPRNALEVPRSFEARALRARQAGDWSTVLEDCWDWADYDPTSSRAMTMGSFVAAVALGDAIATLEFADRGLAAEPDNVPLENNRAVALAYLGRLAEATEQFEKIVRLDGKKISPVVLLATSGLILFRSGSIEEGRQQYADALARPEARGDRPVQALALWHLAFEEARANTSEVERALRRAEEASRGVAIPEIPMLRARVLASVGKDGRARVS